MISINPNHNLIPDYRRRLNAVASLSSDTQVKPDGAFDDELAREELLWLADWQARGIDDPYVNRDLGQCGDNLQLFTDLVELQNGRRNLDALRAHPAVPGSSLVTRSPLYYECSDLMKAASPTNEDKGISGIVMESWAGGLYDGRREWRDEVAVHQIDPALAILVEKARGNDKDALDILLSIKDPERLLVESKDSVSSPAIKSEAYMLAKKEALLRLESYGSFCLPGKRIGGDYDAEGQWKKIFHKEETLIPALLNACQWTATSIETRRELASLISDTEAKSLTEKDSDLLLCALAPAWYLENDPTWKFKYCEAFGHINKQLGLDLSKVLDAAGRGRSPTVQLSASALLLRAKVQEQI